MKYKIIRICEEDYGCEGIPENEELMCSVLVQDIDGNEKLMRIADSYLLKNNLNEGDFLEIESC